MVQPEFPVRWRTPAPGRKHPGKALEHGTKAAPQPPARAGMLLWQQGKHHKRAQAGEQGKNHTSGLEQKPSRLGMAVDNPFSQQHLDLAFLSRMFHILQRLGKRRGAGWGEPEQGRKSLISPGKMAQGQGQSC